MGSTFTVWTVEFWLRVSNVKTSKSFIDLDTTKIEASFNWKHSSTVLATKTMDYSKFYHFAVGYDGSKYFIAVNSDSPTKTSYSSLTLSKLAVKTGQSMFAMKDLRVWSTDNSSMAANTLYNKIDPSVWPKLAHYWQLYGTQLSDSLEDLVTSTTTELKPLGGLMSASYSPTDTDIDLCESSQYKTSSGCEACNSLCGKGCTGPSVSECLSCKSGYILKEGACTGAKHWNTSTASSSLDSESYSTTTPDQSWTLVFYFMIKSASSSMLNFLQFISPSGSIDFSNDSTQAGCTFNGSTFTSSVDANTWIYAAFVSSKSHSFSKCYLSTSTSPKAGVGYKMNGYISFLKSDAEVFVGNVMLSKVALESADLSLIVKVPKFPGFFVEYFTFQTSSSTMFASVESSTDVVTSPVNDIASYCGYGTYLTGSSTEYACSSCSSSDCLACTSSECLLCNPLTSMLSSGSCVKQTAFQASSSSTTSYSLTDKIKKATFSLTAWVYKGDDTGTILQLSEGEETLKFTIDSSSKVALLRSSSELYKTESSLGDEWTFIYLSYERTGSSNSVLTGVKDYETTTTDSGGALIPNQLLISGTDFSSVLIRSVVVFDRAKSAKSLKVYANVAPTSLQNNIVLSLPLISSSSAALGRRLGTVNAQSTLNICDEGYRASEISGTCMPCDDSNCISCETSTYQCDTCKEGYGAIGGVCSSCDSTKKCKNCDGDTSVCSDCYYGQSVDSSGSCVCPDGKWFQDDGSTKECVACYETCATCTTKDTCTTCKSDPIQQVGDYCKYYGVLPSDQSNSDYRAVCIDSAGQHRANDDCNYYLKTYCCDTAKPEYNNCRTSFNYEGCRPCTFYDQNTCNKVESMCWTNYKLNDPPSDSCLTGVYSYCCAKPSECTKFNHKFQCSLLAAPVLKSAVYNSGYYSFDVTFDRAVATKDFTAADCNQYFDQSTVNSFGSAPSCQWNTDSTKLQVTYGSSPTFVYGPFNIKDNTLKSAYKYATEYGSYKSIKVEANSYKPKPLASTSVPTRISYCADLTIDATSSYADTRRNLEYSYLITTNSTVSTGSFYSYVVRFMEFSTTDVVTIPSNILVPNSTVKTVLTVRNFIGETSTSTIETYVSSLPLPTVTFQGGSRYEIFGSTSLLASIAIDIPPCMEQPSMYTVDWSLKSTNYTGTVNMEAIRAAAPNPYSLYYKPGLLKSNYNYVFNAVVYADGATERKGEADIDLTLYPTPPYVVIRGGDRKVSVSKTTVLDGTESNDPDDPNGTISLEWTCMTVYGECFTKTLGNLLTIYPSQIMAGLKYTITLTGHKGFLTSSFTSYIEATEADVPILSIEFPKQKLCPNRINTLSAFVESEVSFTLAWKQLSGNGLTFITPLNQNSVTIGIGSLIEGNSYAFEVSLTAGSTILSSQLSIKANSPPCCGKFKITPAEGYELKTTFTFLAIEWQDPDGDYPMTYSILQNIRGKNPKFLTSMITSNSMKGNLALDSQSETEMELKVYDCYNAVGSAKAKVLVKSGYESQGERMEYVTSAIDEMLVQVNTVPSYIDLAFNLSSVAEAALQVASDDNESQMQAIYVKMVTLIASVYTNYYRIPNISGLISSIVETMTQNPAAMTGASRTRTLGFLDVILTIQADYMEDIEMQNYINILSNLLNSNTNDEEITYADQSAFQLLALEKLLSFGEVYLKKFVRDVEMANFNATHLSLQMGRNSPESLNEATLAFSKEPSSAAIKMPKNYSQYLNVTGDSAVDSYFSVTSFRPYKKANNQTLPETDPRFVGVPKLVSYTTKVSGEVDSTGQIDFYENSTVLNVKNMKQNATIVIPVSIIGSHAQPNCTWLNETGFVWTTSGCYLVNYDSSSVTCNCTHFTDFGTQQIGEDVVNTAATANTDEVIDFGSLADLDFTTNALGLYTAAAVIFFYILFALLFRSWDRADEANYYRIMKEPAERLKIVLNRHKYLYHKMLKIQEDRSPDTERPINHRREASDQKEPEQTDFTFYDYRFERCEEPDSALTELPEVVSSEKSENFVQTSSPDAQLRPEQVYLDPDEVTQAQQELLLKYGVHRTIVNFNIDLEEVKPSLSFQFRVYTNAYIPSKKTLWEIFVFNYPLLEVLFLVKPTFSRVARVTVMTVAVMGRLFTSGLFYNTSESSEPEEEQDFSEILSSFSTYDLWVAIFSALIVLPVCMFLHTLFEVRRPSKKLAREQREEILRKNRRRVIVAYILAWSFMIFFTIEITMFSIQFNQNVSTMWCLNFSFSSAYDTVVQGNLIIILKYVLQTLRGRRRYR